MQIGGFDFVQTSSGCPEQYDVFDKNGNQVCYVRLRWGSLTARCPDVDGVYIYSAGIGDDLAGSFKSDYQRKLHLMKIAKRLTWYTSKPVCPECGCEIILEEGVLDVLYKENKVIVDCQECSADLKVEVDVKVVRRDKERGYDVINRDSLSVRRV